MALKRATVGVDIGHSFVRVVEVEKTAGGYRVAKLGTAPVPKDSIRDGQVNNIEEVSLSIKAAMKEGHIHANHAVIAAAGGAVFVRTVPFPKMTQQMLRESIRYEAARYVPGSVEESYVEGEIAGPLSDTQMNVLLAAAPKDLVNFRIAACELAGLKVDVVEMETFAAFRSILELDPARELASKNYMLVDIGSTNTTVSVIEKGNYVMHRSMPMAGNTLTEALRNAFKLEEVDAEAGKSVLDMHELLQPGAPENPPLKVIQTQVDDLIREFRRSLNYLQTQGQQTDAKSSGEIDAIVLCGGGARMKGLAAYIQARLSVPVFAAGVFDNPAISNPGHLDSKGLELVVATGLAIRGHLKAA